MLLWRARKYLSSRPAALSKVLTCVDWKESNIFEEVDKCLQEWASISPTEAINVSRTFFSSFFLNLYNLTLFFLKKKSF